MPLETGEIVGVIPRMYNDDVPGRGTTLYNGDVDIIVADENFDDPEEYIARFHLDDWNAYGGTGTSWWMADATIGSAGGYSDDWYEVVDTEPIELSGEQITLTFRHRFSAEPPSPPAEMVPGYDGWDDVSCLYSVVYFVNEELEGD